MKLPFGTIGIWRAPASEENKVKARDIKCKVLEEVEGGLLYIFTDTPILPKAKNLTYRTATIMKSDFTLIQYP